MRSVEVDLLFHLESQAMGAPVEPTRSVHSVMQEITSCPGEYSNAPPHTLKHTPLIASGTQSKPLSHALIPSNTLSYPLFHPLIPSNTPSHTLSTADPPSNHDMIYVQVPSSPAKLRLPGSLPRKPSKPSSIVRNNNNSKHYENYPYGNHRLVPTTSVYPCSMTLLLSLR